MDISSEQSIQFGRDMANGFIQAAIQKFDAFSFFEGLSKNTQELGYAAGSLFKGMTKAMGEANDSLGASVGQTFLLRYLPLIILGGIAGTALPLAYNYIYAVMINNIGKPKLALKSRLTTWLSPLIHLYSPPDLTPAPKPIFNQEIEDRVKDIIDSTKNIKNNKSFFQNAIFYGPGGTGKTMLAEMIAKNCDMDYIMMSGGELGQFIKRGEHVTRFNQLWMAAEASKKPVVIFIDEAEALCGSRDKMDQAHLELQDSFLNKTGTQNKKIMFILATNRMKDLDPAVINRATHKLHIDHPGLVERGKIINMYVSQFFENVEERNMAFTPSVVLNMAKKTDKFSGRTLFQMINAIFAKKISSKDNCVTKEMIEQTVEVFAQQEALLRKQGVPAA